MDDRPHRLRELQDRLVRWAQAEPGVRALVVVGSLAGDGAATDRWSDLDLLVAARDPARLTGSAEWLRAIWPTVLVCAEPMGAPGRFAIRVLFEGGMEADITPVPAREFALVARYLALRERAPRLAALVPRAVAGKLERGFRTLLDYSERGRRFLVDKDGYGPPLEAAARRLGPPRRQPPAADEFDRVASGFWKRTLRACKRLDRGDLFMAREVVDVELKEPLKAMVQWHAGATRGWHLPPASWTRPSSEIYHAFAHLEAWAEPRVVEGLRAAYAHYDDADVRRALSATAALFATIARETAAALGYPYPERGEAHALATIQALGAPAAAAPAESDLQTSSPIADP